jgi:predicted phosphodiesterase
MRLGFVSDIHEDITRLRVAIAVLQWRNCDKIICLGDIVGYSVPYQRFLASRNGPEVVALLRKTCDVIVVGNHDLYAIRKLPEHRAGFPYPEDWYTLDYWKRRELGNDKLWLHEHDELSALLRKEDQDFIATLPEFVARDFDGVKILLSHHAYPDLAGTTQFRIEENGLKEHFAFMEKHGCSLGFSGHRHVEGVRMFTPDTATKHEFETIEINPKATTWLQGPAVVNGTFQNGVMVFDTATFALEVIALGTETQLIPEWRNL